MKTVNPKILSVAGFDPSAGAGILSDIKTFEAFGEYGMGVCTAVTVQNDLMFEAVHWVEPKTIIDQIKILTERFSFDVVKIGLIENLDVLERVTDFLKAELEDVKIVWDPIVSASSGFQFHDMGDLSRMGKICKNIYLITPNLHEAKAITGMEDEREAAAFLSKHCNVFLKGGHSEGPMSTDILYSEGDEVSFEGVKFENVEKHGSGCVLSSSIAALLSKEKSLEDSCAEAKAYITEFLISARGLLGVHERSSKFKD
jgi:hydroxymethylpyrimidine/phosphomethylpyrimidine kinase